MKKLLLFLVALLPFMHVTAWGANPFSASPYPLQESSKDVKIFFDPLATDVAALKNATALYAHIGVTLKSDPATWNYVKGSWSDNTTDKKFVKNASGLWELSIGDIREYFGITNNSHKVAAIAVIARTPDGKSGQTADHFISVLDEGFQMVMDNDASSLVLDSPQTITFSTYTTEPADITIMVDNQVIGSAKGATRLSKSHQFATKGKFHTVKATATNGSETIAKEVTVAYPEPSVAGAYPGGIPRQGAVRNADGTVTFCLAAPNKKSVILVPSWDDYQTLGKNVMKYQDYNGFRYFWVTTDQKLDDDVYYPYYYLVDGTIKVSDPYARLVLDNDSDKSLPEACYPNMPRYPYDKFSDTMLAVYRGDIDQYDWDDATLNFQIPDKRSLNIYELLVRDFTGDGTDSDGKHFGTLREARQRIGYLAELGINAVELLPVMEFNGNNSWGYNTNNYMALDKAYGTPEDMRDFVAECHRNGIAVILDIVLNQSDGKHPWYQMYDISSNPFYNENAPHKYNVLNDWNQDCQLVANHWVEVLTYWMEAYKVDGFRFDLVKGLGSNASYGSDQSTDNYNASRIAKMKELHAAIKAVNPDAIHINELLGESSEEKEMGADGQMCWVKVSDGAYQYAMGFAERSGNTRGFVADQWGRVIGQTVDYAESHDEPRVASKVKYEGYSSVKYSVANPRAASVRRLGSVAAQMLMSPGAKMIWQFGELAADDKQGSDLEKLRPIAPKWDHLTVEPRAALHGNYRALCNMRLKNSDMFTGEASLVMTGFADDLSTPRTMRLTKGDKEIIAFFNPSLNKEINVTATSTRLNQNNCQLVTAAYGTSPTLTGTGSSVSVSLPANSFAVFATTAVADVNEIGNDMQESTVSVSTEPGRIIVTGDYTSAEVFNMQGIRFQSFEVPAGFYIVRIDGTPFKVMVK